MPFLSDLTAKPDRPASSLLELHESRQQELHSLARPHRRQLLITHLYTRSHTSTTATPQEKTSRRSHARDTAGSTTSAGQEEWWKQRMPPSPRGNSRSKCFPRLLCHKVVLDAAGMSCTCSSSHHECHIYQDPPTRKQSISTACSQLSRTLSWTAPTGQEKERKDRKRTNRQSKILFTTCLKCPQAMISMEPWSHRPACNLMLRTNRSPLY